MNQDRHPEHERAIPQRIREKPLLAPPPARGNARAETEVDGCPITFPKAKKAREVTFAEHVAPVLKKHCWDCHKDGGSAPFALTSHKQAAGRNTGHDGS